jgi:hypothetical protein
LSRRKERVYGDAVMVSLLIALALQGSPPVTLSPATPLKLDVPAAFTAPDERPLRVLETLQRGVKNTSRRFLLPTLEIGICYTPSLALSFAASTFNVAVDGELPLQSAQDAFWKFNNWNEPTYANWGRNLVSPPVWPDRDALFVNYFIHPWVGATVHLLYRNHGASFWESFFLTFLWAVVWEFVAEGAYERPSLNDIVANVSGALMGEAQHRAKLLVRARVHDERLKLVLLSVIDPFGMLETVVLDFAEHQLNLGPLVQYAR